MESVDSRNENYKGSYQLEVRFKRKINPNVSMSRTTWNLINHFPMSPNKKFSAFMEIKFPEATLKWVYHFNSLYIEQSSSWGILLHFSGSKGRTQWCFKFPWAPPPSRRYFLLYAKMPSRWTSMTITSRAICEWASRSSPLISFTIIIHNSTVFYLTD